jgi:hypothetical protein
MRWIERRDRLNGIKYPSRTQVRALAERKNLAARRDINTERE